MKLSNFFQGILKIVLAILVMLGSSVLVLPSFFLSLFRRILKILLNDVNNAKSMIVKVKKRSYLAVLSKLKFRVGSSDRHFKSSGPEKKKKEKEPKKFSRTFGVLEKMRWLMLGVLVSVVALVIPFYILSWYKDLPKPELLSQRVIKCTKILDRKERLLYEICPENRSDPIALEEIPQSMIDATLAIEDADFYKHGGFKISSMARAFKETVFKDNLQGGSTITQQLVKLTLLTPERTISRKIKELALSVMVERKFKKPEILEMYLNNSPYTGNVVGVESASQKFFGKSIREITLAESALLAGLPSAPSLYSPINSFPLAKGRQKLVLQRMVKLEMISSEQAQFAYDEEISFISQADFIRAPHFVEYIRGELEEMYGPRYVSFGGLTVLTSLDIDIQEEAQQIVEEEVEKVKNLSVSNGSVVVLDVRTGEILAMVGSKDYFNTEIDGKFNVVTADRQPGSTVKVITYSLALTRGYKATSIIDDSPLVIKSGTEFYAPVNYDGVSHGKVTLRKALANSYNISAVRLLKSLNIDDMVKLGNAMGLTTWEVGNDYGLSVTLGGKETNLLDLTNAFGTLARKGLYTESKGFLKIFDSKGNPIFDYENKEKRVLPEEVAYIITNILSDYFARIPAFGVNNMLSVPGHSVAVKTGTSNLKRDNLTVGYTPTYVVGVWVGNNNNFPMSQSLASGLTGAAPIWNRVMSHLILGKTDEPFISPENVVVLSSSDCGREVFIKGTQPQKLTCRSDEDKLKDESKKDKKKDD